jgi:tricarballylate dehydrogenase
LTKYDVIVVGSGNAALCAGIAACERGAKVLMLEKADEALSGGNTKYTAGAMRFAYENGEALLPLIADRDDPRLPNTDFGSYNEGAFGTDLLKFNDGKPLSREQDILVNESYATLRWLGETGVKFEPIFSRQSFEKDGKHVFWGGLTMAAHNEGVGLFDQELAAFKRLGGTIRYDSGVTGLLTEGDVVTGVEVGTESIAAKAVILACGGFESNDDMRAEMMGEEWRAAKVRGTPHNMGDGLVMARALGAAPHGVYGGCHATPMDLHMAPFGNLDIDPGERKNYRKICYFLGAMLNAKGERFVDEGADFRNYTYAQYGRAVLEQPGHKAWQFFDDKVKDLLYAEYHFHDAHYAEADTLDALIGQIDGIDQDAAAATLKAFNDAVDDRTPFDPTIKDGKSARMPLPKTHWAQKLDTPPFRAYPVTGGITFTYGGVRVDDDGAVLRDDGSAIAGLHACGEMVGGVFFHGYPGGSGLTSGAVFGRRAGYGASARAM